MGVELHFFRDLPPENTPKAALGELRFRGFVQRWSRTRRWDAWPASEPAEVFTARVVETLEGIISNHRGQHVVSVAHGGVINAYLGDIIGATDDMFFCLAHASIHRARAKHDRRVVESLNEIHHLSEPDDLVSY